MSQYLSDTIIDFLEYLEIEQNRSQKTIMNYHHYLMRLVEFSGDLTVDKITTETVRKWRLWLNRLHTDENKTISSTTQNYHLIALRSFLKFCSKREIASLPPEKIELARVKRKQVTFLSPEELEALFAQPDIQAPIGLRDRTILRTTYLVVGFVCQNLYHSMQRHVSVKRQ
ncbi:MAG: site-specific integrase [Microthrixaceae bacterium]